jgi:hypothetical protein
MNYDLLRELLEDYKDADMDTLLEVAKAARENYLNSPDTESSFDQGNRLNIALNTPNTSEEEIADFDLSAELQKLAQAGTPLTTPPFQAASTQTQWTLQLNDVDIDVDQHISNTKKPAPKAHPRKSAHAPSQTCTTSPSPKASTAKTLCILQLNGVPIATLRAHSSKLAHTAFFASSPAEDGKKDQQSSVRKEDEPQQATLCDEPADAFKPKR